MKKGEDEFERLQMFFRLLSKVEAQISLIIFSKSQNSVLFDFSAMFLFV